MILGIQSRPLSPAVTYSGWRQPSSQNPLSVNLSNSDRDAEFTATINRPIVTSLATRDRTLGGKYAIRIATATTAGGNAKPPVVGIVMTNAGSSVTNYTVGVYLGGSGNQWSFWVNESGSNELTYTSGVSKNIGSLTPARAWPLYSEVMIELDMDNSRIWLGADGIWEAGADPSTGTLPTYTYSTGSTSTIMMLVCERYYFSGGRVRLLLPSESAYPASTGFTLGWPNP